MALRTNVALIGALFALLVGVGLPAPIGHDEALLVLELSGHASWPEGIAPAAVRKSTLVDSNTGIQEVFHNIASLRLEVNPPFYFLVIWAWSRLVPDNLVWLRIFSTLAWIGVLYGTWRWSGSRMTVALLAIAPLGVAVATLGRNYALACLWIMLCAWLLDPDRGASRLLGALGLMAGALAVWTHYLAAIPIVVIFLARGRRRVLAAVVMLALLALMVWAAAPIGSSHAWQMRLTKSDFPGVLAESYATFRLLLRQPVSPNLDTGRLVDFVGSAVFLLAILSAAVRFRTLSYKVRLSFCIVLLHAVALVVLSTISATHLAAARYLVLVLPFGCLLIADACDHLGAASLYARCAIIALALFCASNYSIRLLRIEHTQKEFWTKTEGAKPDLVMIATPVSSPAIPAVILFGVPGQVDVWMVPWDTAAAAMPGMAANHGRLVFCPSGEQALQAVERGLAQMSLTSTPQLFREYSCDVWK